MNRRAWDKIPPDLQKVLLETMDESRKWQDAEVEKLNAAALERFKSNGAHVEVLGPKELKAFSDAAMSAERAFLEDSGLGAASAVALKSVRRK